MRGVHVRPIGQQHHMIPIRRETLAIAGLDHDGPVEPRLFLEARVRVVPIGPVLIDLEAIRVCTTRWDAFEAETGHAVHVRRNDHAVPMDRRALAQRIADMQRNRIPLSPSQQGRGQLPVHDCRDTRSTGKVRRRDANAKIESSTREDTVADRCRHFTHRRSRRTEHECARGRLHESPSRHSECCHRDLTRLCCRSLSQMTTTAST
jgi:hypothetical protein